MLFNTTLKAATVVVAVSCWTAELRGDADVATPHARAQSLSVGSADAADAIRSVLRDMTANPAKAESTRLPVGTSVGRIAWADSILHVDLVLPAEHPLRSISALDMETLGEALRRPFIADPSFGGTIVRILRNDGEPVPSAAVPAADPVSVQADADPVAVGIARQYAATPLENSGGGVRALGGPTSNATRQPAGALSGVTIFTSGGHGWTAPSSGDWFLQRNGDLLGMNEDYGNLDQLNYFVHHAFNAGATVVPFRPVGYQTIEIVMDNDDPGVTFTGAWTTNTTNAKYYGDNPSERYEFSSAELTETATARYTPNIAVTDFYPVYCFAIASDNRTLQTYRVKHSGGISEVAVDHRLVGNGWVWLGEYHLEAGGDSYVEITNLSPEAGVVIADAIRWGNGMGDIVRPGPGSVSGYPRHEECARYWAHSEVGNHATGFDSGIWDVSGSSDSSDNVGTAARWAREMNQTAHNNDRWRRVYLEFHTNAAGCGGGPPCTARGCIGLISDSPPNYTPTTFQAEFAAFMADEIDQDLPLLDGDFEHTWIDRASSTYTSAFGAIRAEANGDEFDATIIELAFHDNQEDAELLRDSRVRAAMAKSSVHGIIRFLNWLPGSTVPLAFPPATPGNVRAEDLANGDIAISWDASPSGEEHGDPATGYVVYVSTNGYGFGNPIVLGSVLNTIVTGVPRGETRYFRIAATNSGGESMPSEILATRRPASGSATLLLVNGFDALRRQQNPVQAFTFPPAYVGDAPERQMWRDTNSYDYMVQFADAVSNSTASTLGFASSANEAIVDLQVSLNDYDIAMWILGTESSLDATFDPTEQSRVSSFLNGGGALFVSGADLGFDLIGQGNGVSFMQDTLRSGYVSDDAGTFDVSGAASGILHDIGPFDFDRASGAPYVVYAPDVLSAQSGAVPVLDYVGGSGGVAGVQYDASVYRVVSLGFPFEAITSASTRADVMARIMTFLAATPGPLPFDFDKDGDVDKNDHAVFVFCHGGPTNTYPNGHICLDIDQDGDSDVDFAEWAVFQQVYTGPM